MYELLGNKCEPSTSMNNLIALSDLTILKKYSPLCTETSIDALLLGIVYLSKGINMFENSRAEFPISRALIVSMLPSFIIPKHRRIFLSVSNETCMINFNAISFRSTRDCPFRVQNEHRTKITALFSTTSNSLQFK